jgi:hypothetical protein
LGKILKFRLNRCLSFSSYSHPEIWEFQGVTQALAAMQGKQPLQQKTPTTHTSIYLDV